MPHLTVDSNDADSIVSMMQQTKCVLTTVGPYQLVWSKHCSTMCSSWNEIMLIYVVSQVGCMK